MKIVVVTFWVEGPLVFDTLLGQVDPADYGKVYGEDWIRLRLYPRQRDCYG